jgi:hypothetical protein
LTEDGGCEPELPEPGEPPAEDFVGELAFFEVTDVLLEEPLFAPLSPSPATPVVADPLVAEVSVGADVAPETT